MKQGWRVLFLTLGFTAAWASANAQNIPAPEAGPPERTSVLQRPRPDYDALGGRLGAFTLFPTVDLNETYNSNIFATPSATVSDFGTTLSPAISAGSNWNTNALSFQLGGQMQRYAHTVSENVTNANAGVNGRLDVENGIFFTGGLSYQLQHEARTSPDTVFNQKYPIEYQQGTTNLGFVHDTGRLAFTSFGSVNDYSYNNGVTSTGTIIPETDRNRMEYNFTPRLAYEIVPGYHAYIQTPLNLVEYQAQFDHNGIDRNSHGYEVDAGTALALGKILNGEVYVGYLEQDYEAHSLSPTSSVAFGGNLLWNVTQITSIRAAASTSVQQTTIAPASGVLQTSIALSVEHELLRNVLLTGGVSYLVQDFQGTTRVDDTYEGDLGARYLLNRNLNTGISLTYRQRSSNATPPAGYTQEIAAVNIRLQF